MFCTVAIAAVLFCYILEDMNKTMLCHEVFEISVIMLPVTPIEIDDNLFITRNLYIGTSR